MKLNYISHAEWPSEAGVQFSDDTHPTKEAAEAVCSMLRENGFGGNGVIYPLRTWVTTKIVHTLKGERFADVIKNELKNSESVLSVAVRDLKAMTHLCKTNPHRYKMELFGGYLLYTDEDDRVGNDYGSVPFPTSFSGMTDVGYLFPK